MEALFLRLTLTQYQLGPVGVIVVQLTEPKNWSEYVEASTVHLLFSHTSVFTVSSMKLPFF